MDDGAQDAGADGEFWRAVTARWTPSADQENATGAPPTSISVSVPALSGRTRRRTFPARSEIQAMRSPSGDQRGDESTPAPSVQGRRSRPSAVASQRFERSWYLSA